MARVIAEAAARVMMRMLEGGDAFTCTGGTFSGGFPVALATMARRVEQKKAEERREKKKPTTRIREILARSGAGRAGASGIMTRLGTKKTASQRVRKATPGLKRRLFVASTEAERPMRRASWMEMKMMSMAASEAGKERWARLRRWATALWTIMRTAREKSWEENDRRVDIEVCEVGCWGSDLEEAEHFGDRVGWGNWGSWRGNVRR